MQEIVVIKPKTRRKKLFSAATQYREVSEGNGRTKRVELGQYNGERFPNTRQMIRPKFNIHKRHWIVEGLSPEELKELVPKCGLRYEGKHKLTGDLIQDANMYDWGDPFFNHSELKVIMTEGGITLDPKQPLHRVILASIEGDHEFGSTKNSNSLLSTRVKYQVVNERMKLEASNKQRRVKMEALRLFDALTFEKKKRIALALGLRFGADIQPEWIDDQIWKYVDDDQTRIDGRSSLTKQDLFVQIAKMKDSELSVKVIMAKAINGGFLRKRKKEGYILFGNPVGKNQKQVETYLKDPENQEMLLKLEEAIDDKSDETPIRSKKKDTSDK